MDSQNPKTPLDSAILLLRSGMFDKFLELKSYLNEDTIKEAVCSYARELIGKNPNPWAIFPKIKNIREGIIYSFDKDSVVRTEFNKTIKDFIKKYNIVKNWQRLYEAQDGTITASQQDIYDLVGDCVDDGQISKSRYSVFEKFYRNCDLKRLPRRVRIAMNGVLCDFGIESLRVLLIAARDSDWSQPKEVSHKNEKFNP